MLKLSDNKTLIALLALLVLVLFLIFSPLSQDNPKSDSNLTESPTTTPGEPDEVKDGDSESNGITTYHFYKDGMHTFFGTVDVPTPCDNLYVDVTVRESYPEQVELNFSTEKAKNKEDQICAQVITPREYRATVKASNEATFSANLNDSGIDLEVVEVTEKNYLDYKNGETSLGW